MTQDTRGVEESVSLAIEAALDLSDDLKADMHSGGEFDKAARAAIAAMSRPEAVTDELVEALVRVRNGLRSRDSQSRVMHPVGNERLIAIIDAALSKVSTKKENNRGR